MHDDSDYYPSNLTSNNVSFDTFPDIALTPVNSMEYSNFDILLEFDEESIKSEESIESEEDEPVTIIDSFTEDEVFEIINTIYGLFDDYYENNIISISSPTYYKGVIENAVFILYTEWLVFNVCDEDDIEDIKYFVEQIHEEYIDIISPDIPERSSKYITYKLPQVEESINKELSVQIDWITNQPQPVQRSEEWYKFRNSLLTASNLWKALGSQAQQNSLIFEKCNSINNPDNYYHGAGVGTPMHWGVRYEPVTIMIYEDMYQTKIGEFGCIRHPEYNYIGASPDGINILESSIKYGNMLEIKNIVNREITGIPKEEYWIQTQIQMETCGLEKCDFVETRIKEYDNEEDLYLNTYKSDYRGVVLYFIKNDFTKNEEPYYVYMPLNIELMKESVDNWIENEKEKLKDEYVLYNRLYWYLDEISCVLIQRNRKWFNKALPRFNEIWKTIEEEKDKGYEHRAPKKRIPKIQINVDDVSGVHSISNLPDTKSICLIKLDSSN